MFEIRKSLVAREYLFNRKAAGLRAGKRCFPENSRWLTVLTTSANLIHRNILAERGSVVRCDRFWTSMGERVSSAKPVQVKWRPHGLAP